MKTKYSKYIILTSVLFVGILVYFLITYIHFLRVEEITLTESDDPYVLKINESMTYYFMDVNDMGHIFYDQELHNMGSYTEVLLAEQTYIKIYIRNLDDMSYTSISPTSFGTTLTLYDYEVLGKITLEPGTYEIDIITLQGDTDTYSFKLQSDNMYESYAIINLTSLSLGILVIVFVVLMAKHVKIIRRERFALEEAMNQTTSEPPKDPWKEYTDNSMIDS